MSSKPEPVCRFRPATKGRATKRIALCAGLLVAACAPMVSEAAGPAVQVALLNDFSTQRTMRATFILAADANGLPAGTRLSVLFQNQRDPEQRAGGQPERLSGCVLRYILPDGEQLVGQKPGCVATVRPTIGTAGTYYLDHVEFKAGSKFDWVWGDMPLPEGRIQHGPLTL